MGNLYTISDLCQLLSVTRPIVDKKLKRLWNNQPIPYTSTTVNNRDIKAIELTEKQLSILGITDTEQNSNDTDIETHNNTYNEPVKLSYHSDDIIYKIIDQSNEYVTRIESYTQRIINAESQVKLLTMVDSNKDYEINELRANNKKLQMENTELVQKIYELEFKNQHLAKENQELNQQLELERNKPFWKKKVL